jgi:hypothetical protein
MGRYDGWLWMQSFVLICVGMGLSLVVTKMMSHPFEKR